MQASPFASGTKHKAEALATITNALGLSCSSKAQISALPFAGGLIIFFSKALAHYLQ